MQIRRSLSSKIPSELIDGELELGHSHLRSGRRAPDHDCHLSRIICPSSCRRSIGWPSRAEVSIKELGEETFIAHNVVSPYRALVIREFQRHKVPLNMDLEMPTVEAIRKMVRTQ